MAETSLPAVTGYEYTENHRISVCRWMKSVKKHRFLLQIMQRGRRINDSCVKSNDGKQESLVLAPRRTTGK